MALDIGTKINEIAEKIKGDKNLMAKFKENPITAIESIVGIDLPDDQIKPLIEGVKAKLAGGGLMDTIGGLFGKK